MLSLSFVPPLAPWEQSFSAEPGELVAKDDSPREELCTSYLGLAETSVVPTSPITSSLPLFTVGLAGVLEFRRLVVRSFICIFVLTYS